METLGILGDYEEIMGLAIKDFVKAILISSHLLADARACNLHETVCKCVPRNICILYMLMPLYLHSRKQRPNSQDRNHNLHSGTGLHRLKNENPKQLQKVISERGSAFRDLPSNLFRMAPKLDTWNHVSQVALH